MHGRKNSFLSLQTPALNKIMSHRSGMTVFFILDLSYASQDFLYSSNAGVISTNLIHTSHIKNPGAMRKCQKTAFVPRHQPPIPCLYTRGLLDQRPVICTKARLTMLTKKIITGYLKNLSLRNQPRGSKKNETKQPGNARPGMS